MATSKLAGVEHRGTTRGQMAFATEEIVFCVVEIATRFDETPQTAALATAARNLAADLTRLQASADATPTIDEINLRTLGRVYVEAAIHLAEVCELTEFAALSETAGEKAAAALAWVSDLVAVSQALVPGWGASAAPVGGSFSS